MCCDVAYKDNFKSELPDVGQDLSDVSLTGQPLPEPEVHLDPITRHQRQLGREGERDKKCSKFFIL